ncbi:MAG: hypothetical protein ACTHMD_13735 [Flavisolibacter sp.]
MESLLGKTKFLAEYIKIQQSPFMNKLKGDFNEEDQINFDRYYKLREEIEDAAILLKKGDKVIFNDPDKNLSPNIFEGIVHEIGHSIKVKSDNKVYTAFPSNGIERIDYEKDIIKKKRLQKNILYIAIILVIGLTVGIVIDNEILKYSGIGGFVIGYIILYMLAQKTMERQNKLYQHRKMREIRQLSMKIEIGYKQIAEEICSTMQKNIKNLENRNKRIE